MVKSKRKTQRVKKACIVKSKKQGVGNGWECGFCGSYGIGKSNGLGGHLRWCNKKHLQTFPVKNTANTEFEDITFSDVELNFDDSVLSNDRIVCEIISQCENDEENDEDCIDLFIEDINGRAEAAKFIGDILNPNIGNFLGEIE